LLHPIDLVLAWPGNGAFLLFPTLTWKEKAVELLELFENLKNPAHESKQLSVTLIRLLLAVQMMPIQLIVDGSNYCWHGIRHLITSRFA
jgi:hypothetical protein